MYRIIRFGTTNLEYYNQVDDISSGDTPVSNFDLPEGGAIDNFGDQQKAPGAYERIKKLTLVGSTEDAVAAQFFGLMGLRGKRDKLFRRNGAGDYSWQYARLWKLPASRDYQKTRYKWMQDVEMHFWCQDANWRGLYRGPWKLNDGIRLDCGYALGTGEWYALAASPATITITNGASMDAGRAEVRSMQIIVSAGASAMSGVTIARAGGESLSYPGTIPSGGQLIINTSTMQVSCTGVALPYNVVEFAPTADMAAWFTLQPGDNVITVTYTGGGTGKAIEFIFNEAWN